MATKVLYGKATRKSVPKMKMKATRTTKPKMKMKTTRTTKPYAKMPNIKYKKSKSIGKRKNTNYGL